MSADIRLLRWPHNDREEYERLAAALARVRTSVARGRGEIVATVPTGPEEPSDLDRAHALFAQRRARDRAAGTDADLFGEPAWDLLLVLFIGYEEGRVLRLDHAFDVISLRGSIRQRWLDLLQKRDLIRVDGGDPQAPTVALTDAGLAMAIRCVRDA